MGATFKSGISFEKKDLVTDKALALGVKKIVFAHKFSANGTAQIDLAALTIPTELSGIGFINPSSAQLLSSKIYLYPDNLQLTSSSKGLLIRGVSYDIVSSSIIRLKNGAESEIDEIIYGIINPVNINGLPMVDAKQIVQTGALGVGLTDILINDYFELNKYSSQQVGDVILIGDGIVQFRNIGNSVSGDGNYYELPPTSGYLSNTLRLNVPVSGSPLNYIVISNGLKTERPTEGVIAKVETVAGQLDKVIQDLAIVTGNPTANYQTAPNSPDLKFFGERVVGYISGVFTDAVVGSATQFAKGLCTHTTIQAAINSALDGGMILVLQGTYAENLIINKKVYILGKGHGSYLNGSITFQNLSDYSMVEKIRCGSVTMNLGADGIHFINNWLVSGAVLTDGGLGNNTNFNISE